jgi:dihydrofolate reductase
MATLYYTATTIDGFIADPDNSLQWLFDVPQTGETTSALDAVLDGVGSIVMGATTYQWLLDHEGYLDAPQKWTDTYADRPTWVLTHRALPPVPGCDIRVGPRAVAELHPELLAAAGERHVWVIGGGDLAGQFADAGLLDEIHLGVAPVALGAGAPLLPRRILSDRLSLRSVAQQDQFAMLVYDLLPPT